MGVINTKQTNPNHIFQVGDGFGFCFFFGHYPPPSRKPRKRKKRKEELL